jgi:hypothetical protein
MNDVAFVSLVTSALLAFGALGGCSAKAPAIDSCPTEDCVPDGGGSGGGSGGGFVFSTAPSSEYVQVDRAGFVGTNRLLDLLGDKDAYNESSLDDDLSLARTLESEESMNIWLLGLPGMQTEDNTGLYDDMLALGFHPCTPPPEPQDRCDDQMRPLTTPDVIQIRADQPSNLVETGEFNGRKLDDPVVDFVLARLWLDLAEMPADQFFDYDGDGTPGPSLNPRANDEPFLPAFPYLAAAHATSTVTSSRRF